MPHCCLVVEMTQRSEIKMGVFLLIGAIMLGALIVQFGRFGDRFRDFYSLTMIVDDAAGIIKGSDVRMGGAKIGKVAALPELIDNAKVRIALKIEDRIKIPVGSTFGIDSASIMGDKMIVVTVPKTLTKESIPAGAEMIGAGPSGLDAIQSNAEIVSNDARQLMENAAGTLKKVDEAMDNIRLASSNLSQTLEKVNQSILSSTNLTHVNDTLSHVAKTSEHFETASAELQPTIKQAQQAIASVESAARSAQNTMRQVDERMAELKPFFQELPKTTAAFGRAAVQADHTLQKIQQGKGLIGMLTEDAEVASDAKHLISNLRQHGILRYQDGDDIPPSKDPRRTFRGISR